MKLFGQRIQSEKNKTVIFSSFIILIHFFFKSLDVCIDVKLFHGDIDKV